MRTWDAGTTHRSWMWTSSPPMPEQGRTGRQKNTTRELIWVHELGRRCKSSSTSHPTSISTKWHLSSLPPDTLTPPPRQRDMFMHGVKISHESEFSLAHC
eukprot:3684747-Rhodomonas_salina.1